MLNYTTFTTQFGTLTANSTADPNFLSTMLPGAIDYAEQRIYREADFLTTYQSDITNCSSSVGSVANPTNVGTFLVLSQVYVSTSVSTSYVVTPFYPLSIASLSFMSVMYPSAGTSVGLPKYFCPLDDAQIQLGPVPDLPYLMQFYGTQRPIPLSAVNSSTWLTQTLPDLFMAAAMIYASGYMKNFGAQADNPQMSLSWSTQYDKLFASANIEELRKRYFTTAWQSHNINSLAQRS